MTPDKIFPSLTALCASLKAQSPKFTQISAPNLY